MRRFAIILFIAVLAMGCVFAASTGDDSNNKVAGANATSGDKIYVTTTIGRIYPVYQISATNDVDTVKSDDAKSSANTITGKKVTNATTGEETVSVKVSIQHYGLENNDASATNMTNIRYYGSVKVTVTASSLKNTAYSSYSDAFKAGHTYESTILTVTAFEDANTLAYCTVTPGDATGSDSSNFGASASVTVAYGNGTVLTGSTAQTIANECTFTWTTTHLTAGDDYEATITVQYESV